MVVKRLRFNSPTQTLINEIIEELRNASTLITTIDGVVLYNAGAQAATGVVSTMNVNTDGSLSITANVNNNSASSIQFDEIAVVSGTKEYYRKTLGQVYSIAPGDTLTLDILISHVFQIDQNSNYQYLTPQQELGIVLSRRLSGQQTTRMNITGGEAIDINGNTIPASMNVGIPSGNTLPIQFSLSSPFPFNADYFGVTINGLTKNPQGPSGYALLYSFTRSISSTPIILNLSIIIQ